MKKLNINWKYAFGEILLLFVGITLAITFNNWNSNSQIDQNKAIAITKINNELTANLVELQIAHQKNGQLGAAIDAFQGLFYGNSSQIYAATKQMDSLQEIYPDFFRITSQSPVNDSIVLYQGESHILLELPELSDIAWETARNMVITNSFNYECLYELESIYNLQERAVAEIDKTAQFMLESNLPKLIGQLRISGQINQQLLADYQAYVERPFACN